VLEKVHDLPELVARLLPIDRKSPMPCLSTKLRNRKNHSPKNTSAGRIQESRSRSGFLSTTRV